MVLEYIKVFIVGGIICLIAQIMMDYFKMQTPYVMVTYVSLGAILTFLGVYEPIVKFAGAGATVPLTGFGYTMAKGTMEFLNKNGPIGILTGGLTSAASGISAAIFFGYLSALLSKPGDKS